MPMSPKLLRPRATGTVVVATDADARAYVLAVNAADGQPLEAAVQLAINGFVVGCKADGLWSAIKASCLLMGARTLSGALTPLVGAAPTNNNFVSGDYNRKTGLVGNGSTKFLNTNRNNNADPQNSFHAACYVQTGATTSGVYVGAGPVTNETGASNFGFAFGSNFYRNRTSGVQQFSGNATGFIGTSRSQSASFLYRRNGASATATAASETPYNGNLCVFNSTPTSSSWSNARLAFYSIGESLDLALFDSRVTTLFTAIGAAIP